ncbi:MAG: hypothetical protein SGARI_001742 [Bacillariaceae sp.]
MAECQEMKAGDLKKELQERDFVKAAAEARVDSADKEAEEGYAEYTDVEVLTDESSGPRQRRSESEEPQSGKGSPFGGGAGASPFGGAGGMGGIADILNGMGMGGAASPGAGAGGSSPFGGATGGGNPFSGMGANPFGGMGGDAMGKAQEMMKNPKVMELMMKAQGNPKVMAAMQECMSNPAAFSKYQNDPEVSELINEMKKYI